MRWIEGCLAVRLVARDAFGLDNRRWFVGGAGRPTASHADPYAGAERDGRRNVIRQAAAHKPHGVYDTSINSPCQVNSATAGDRRLAAKSSPKNLVFPGC